MPSEVQIGTAFAMFHGGNRGLLAFSNRSRSNNGNQSTVSWKGTGRWAAEHFFLLVFAQWSVSFEETVICFPVVVRPHGVAVETSGRWTTSKWYDSTKARQIQAKSDMSMVSAFTPPSFPFSSFFHKSKSAEHSGCRHSSLFAETPPQSKKKILI